MKALPHSIREGARRAFVTGTRVVQIAAEIGVKRVTVSQWAKRGGWASERGAAVEQRMESVLHSVEDVTIRHILRHKEQVQRLVEAQIDSLANIPLKEVHSVLEVARALKALDDVGRRNLSMDSESSGSVGPRPTFNFNLRSVEVVRKCDLPPAQPPAIVIESKVV